MAKILAIGDLHYQPSNMEESIKLNSLLLKIINSASPDLVVVLGDTLHTHKRIDMGCLVLAKKFFLEVSSKVPLIVLIGNHDRINNSDYMTDHHPFFGMDIPKRLDIIGKTTKYQFKDLTIGLVPYVYPGRFHEAISTVFTPEDIKTVDIIFAHQEIRGVKMGFESSKIGDVWPENYPMLVSGHIHQYQQLAPNIIYPGTPRMIGHGDSMDKTVSLFTLVKSKWVEHRMDIPLPKLVTLHINFKDITSTVFTTIPTRVVIRGTPDEIKSLSTNPKILEWKKQNIMIKTILVKKISHTPPISSLMTSRHSFSDQLSSYISSTYPGPDSKPHLDHLRSILN